MPLSKDSKIIIAGSGVFGLSTALHLVENGYTDITIFDRLDLYKMQYSFINGADTASADINKMFRAFYNGDELYHKLALRARETFVQWDKEIRGMSPEEAKRKYNIDNLRVLDQCGSLRLDKGAVLPKYLVDTLQDFKNSGLRDTQYNIDDEEDMKRAEESGLAVKFKDLFGENPYLREVVGTFDSTSGILAANNACLIVATILREKGVKFITGEAGTIKHLIEKDNGSVEGFLTADGKEHWAALSIVACGPWSSSLLPELAGLSEAQNGNVILIKIPGDRKDLLKKYSSENFPVVLWKTSKEVEREKFGGIGIFPINSPEGFVKLIVRQRKYNNPTRLSSGTVTSVPVTSNSKPSETRLSKHILTQVKQFIKVFLPDLTEFGIYTTRLLWYTDSINNDFIIDNVPGRKNCVIVTGGSGHGFKFLPVLGQFAVDVIEGNKTEFTQRFKWRDPKDHYDVNTISTVLTGEAAYYDQELATDEDLKFTEEELKSPVKLT